MTNQVRVLIVEDEFLSAKLMGNILERLFDYQICDLVATGELAITRAGETKPDIVLMDINLASHMNGIEAARTIRELYGTPIIFITGYASEEYRSQCQELKPVAILDKPVGPDALNCVIKSAFV